MCIVHSPLFITFNQLCFHNFFIYFQQTKAVSTTLQPGTAINVTLTGNYTRIEAPYKATLVSFYEDTNDSVSRRIESTVSEI